jgi:ribosomal protein L37E
MRTEFCIYCGLTAESSAVVDSRSGSIHESCCAFLSATSDDRDARRARVLERGEDVFIGREQSEKTPNMLCNRCGAAIGNNASTCVSCGADSFVRATYEAGEAPKKWNGCLAAAGGFGIAGALAIFGLFFAFIFALGWLNDHVLCMFSTGSCKW